MKRFRKADSGVGQDDGSSAAELELTEPVLAPAQEGRVKSQNQERAENRSGTIEASPISRGAIGVIAAKKYHAVDDNELSRLMRLERPISLSMAAAFGGIFIGSAWPVAGTIQELFAGIGPPDSYDLILMIACLVSLGISVAATLASTRNRGKLAAVVETIRKRAKITLPPGHPLAPG